MAKKKANGKNNDDKPETGGKSIVRPDGLNGFEFDLVRSIAADVWASARDLAAEQRSGSALNSQRMTACIERHILAAAATIAERIESRRQPLEALKTQLAESRAIVREIRATNRALEQRLARLESAAPKTD